MCWGDVINCPLDWTYIKIMDRIIPHANMPLFTFLAGYLFFYQLRQGKYSDYKLFFKNKIHRLLIPYLILGTLILYTKYDYGRTLEDVIYGIPNQMWYCLMLFYCFAICWLVEKKIGSFANACLAVLSLAVFSRFATMNDIYQAYHWPSGIEIAAYFYFFFYFGGICNKYKDTLFQGWKSVVIFMLMYLLVKVPLVRLLSYILLVFSIAEVLCPYVEKSKHTSIALNKVAECSFGIYVIHSIILWNISHWPPILKYTAPILEGHYIIAPIVLAIVAFFVSLGLTDLLLRTKVGKYLLA